MSVGGREVYHVEVLRLRQVVQVDGMNVSAGAKSP